MNATLWLVSKRRQICLPQACLLVCLLSQAALAAAAPGDETWQDPESIRERAAAAVRDSIAIPGARTVAVADQLDSRLRLAACDRPLDAELPFSAARTNRVTVEVRCDGSASWKVFLPVHLETFGDVVVAARAIAREQVLTADDLTVVELELGNLQRGHISVPEHAMGKKTRRAIAAGAPLTPAVLATPPAIRRGQKVTVRATGSQLSIATTATALADGGIGEIIEVANASSGRTVQAIVRSAQLVEVLLD